MICVGQKEKKKKSTEVHHVNFFVIWLPRFFTYALLEVCRIISEFSHKFYRGLFIECCLLLFSVVCDNVVHL